MDKKRRLTSAADGSPQAGHGPAAPANGQIRDEGNDRTSDERRGTTPDSAGAGVGCNAIRSERQALAVQVCAQRGRERSVEAASREAVQAGGTIGVLRLTPRLDVASLIGVGCLGTEAGRKPQIPGLACGEAVIMDLEQPSQHERQHQGCEQPP